MATRTRISDYNLGSTITATVDFSSDSTEVGDPPHTEPTHSITMSVAGGPLDGETLTTDGILDIPQGNLWKVFSEMDQQIKDLIDGSGDIVLIRQFEAEGFV